MSKIGRAVAAGYPHHVIQRGNNREAAFFEREDRKRYLSLLKKYAEKWTTPVMAYCLMSNHIHLLAKPGSLSSFPGQRYLSKHKKSRSCPGRIA
jgi:REP-associated tyrosine transposase